MALKALKQISEINSTEVPQEDEQEIIIPKTKWLFFYIGETKYCIRESQIVNILRDEAIFDFPFAPPFVEGVINFHNNICSAVNFRKLINENSDDTDSNLLLVFKTDSDDLCLKVTRIDDFFMIPDESYTQNENTDNDIFTEGYLLYENENIPVLNIISINKKVISFCKKEPQL